MRSLLEPIRKAVKKQYDRIYGGYVRGWQYYGTGDVQLVPLMPDTPVYKDGMLSYLYYRTKEEDKLSRTFHSDDFGHDKFIAYFEKLKTLQVLCEVEANKDLKPVGYCWVESPVGVDGARAAICGFCFFNGASKRISSRNLGMLANAYWFTDLKIDVVHGVLLADNYPAQNYATRLGFKKTATVPKWRYVGGALVDVVAVTLESVDFMPIFGKWREKNPVAIAV